FMPRLAAIRRAKQGGIFYTGIKSIRIVQRRLDVPHPLELPRMLRPVVPLVRRDRLTGLRRRVIAELIALALWHAARASRRLARRRPGLKPRFAAIIGTLNHLPEPA